MKISLQFKHQSEKGVALIIALTFAVLCGTVLGTYLLLVSSDGKTVARSQDWNCALTYAEAGVDEALAQINASPDDFSANSWGSSGGAYGPVTRNMPDGYYTVKIVGSSVPTIYATGFVKVASSGQMVSRAVKISATQLGLLPVAFAAINDIQMNGNGITSDSYNSHLSSLSTGGLYDPNKTSTNGNVASVQGIVDPGNHTIMGSLYLGPTATYSGGSGNVNGSIYYDYNVQFDPVTLPASPQLAIPDITYTTVITPIYKGNGQIKGYSTNTTSTYGYHFKTANNNKVYEISQDYPIEIDAGVSVKLVVTSSSYTKLTSLQIHDGGNQDNSGTAYMYFDGPSSIAAAGNGAIDASGRPENLWIYGTDKLTSITFSGNAQFTGIIYAPNATISLNGGGNNSLDVAGSLVVKSITVNGHFALHYDESLSSLSSRGFIPSSWQEL